MFPGNLQYLSWVMVIMRIVTNHVVTMIVIIGTMLFSILLPCHDVQSKVPIIMPKNLVSGNSFCTVC